MLKQEPEMFFERHFIQHDEIIEEALAPLLAHTVVWILYWSRHHEGSRDGVVLHCDIALLHESHEAPIGQISCEVSCSVDMSTEPFGSVPRVDLIYDLIIQ